MSALQPLLDAPSVHYLIIDNALPAALFAQARLEFGRGLSNEDEPDLCLRDYTGDVDLWIDLGQPDESRIRKACGKAGEVIVVNYGGRAADLWWDRNAALLARHRNLTVLDIAAETVDAVTALMVRSMRFNVMIQDGEMQWMTDDLVVSVIPSIRQAGLARAA